MNKSLRQLFTIVVALFVSAALLKRNVEPAKILVIYPCVALATLAAIYFIQKPVMCLAGGFLLVGWRIGFMAYMAAFAGATLAGCVVLFIWLKKKGCRIFAAL